MSEKTLRIVMAAVAALAVVYLGATLGGRLGGSDAPEDAAPPAAALERVRQGEVLGVRVAEGGDTAVLRREENGWTVNGSPADSARVAALLEALASARAGHVASVNPSSHARLGVAADSARAVDIALVSGDTVRLLLGGAGPSWPSAYVRVPGADEVVLVQGDLRGRLSPRPDDWRAVPPDTAAGPGADTAAPGADASPPGDETTPPGDGAAVPGADTAAAAGAGPEG